MQFFDNEVSSKAGATTPNDPNFFTAEKVLQAANPNAESPLAKAGEGIKQRIKQMEPDLLRALMATTGRKAMEFVPKSSKIFKMKFDEQGDVTTQDGTYDKEEVRSNLNSPNSKVAEAWTETLDAYGYFNSFPDMKPGVGAGTAPVGTSGTPQAFEDAEKALIQLGFKKPEEQKEMKKFLVQAWTDLKATKDPSQITHEELVKAVLKKKKGAAETPEAPAPETPSGADISNPAGAPAPTTKTTAPVSGGASGPAPSKEPTAPVSDKGKEDAAAAQTQPTAGQQGQGDSGKINIKGDDLEWENPNSHEVHSISPDQVVTFAKTKPKFLSALKANPDVYKKYQNMINQKIALKKKKRKWTDETRGWRGRETTGDGTTKLHQSVQSGQFALVLIFFFFFLIILISLYCCTFTLEKFGRQFILMKNLCLEMDGLELYDDIYSI